MKHVIKVMAPLAGDEEVSWDPHDYESVKKAKKAFDKLIKKGHKIYKVTKQTVTRKGEQISDFDPTVGEYVAVPPMAGG